MKKKMYYNIWKSPFKIRFQKKKNISSSGAQTHELRAEIEKFFVRFLVQMKSAKSPFEINWPLSAIYIGRNQNSINSIAWVKVGPWVCNLHSSKQKTGFSFLEFVPMKARLKEKKKMCLQFMQICMDWSSLWMFFSCEISSLFGGHMRPLMFTMVIWVVEFSSGASKLEKILPKNQHTHR